jgi:hypothetical protein
MFIACNYMASQLFHRTMNSLNVSTDQLRRALQIKEQIESLQAQLTSLLTGQFANRKSSIGNAVRRRRTMSTSARARIAAAARVGLATAPANDSVLSCLM